MLVIGSTGEALLNDKYRSKAWWSLTPGQLGSKEIRRNAKSALFHEAYQFQLSVGEAEEAALADVGLSE